MERRRADKISIYAQLILIRIKAARSRVERPSRRDTPTEKGAKDRLSHASFLCDPKMGLGPIAQILRQVRIRTCDRAVAQPGRDVDDHIGPYMGAVALAWHRDLSQDASAAHRLYCLACRAANQRDERHRRAMQDACGAHAETACRRSISAAVR